MNPDATTPLAQAAGSAVYVDDSVWPFGRMMMCHMFADRAEALHAMADRIGVQRKWFQDKPGFPHYDICKSKRALAVACGAVEVNRRQFVEIVGRMRSSPNAQRERPAEGGER